MPEFCHLHCHTQFSLLDGAASIPGMIAKAKADGQKAVAITDHGNMFGAFKFVAEAQKEGILPIVGCEFYLVEDRFRKEFTGGKKDQRFHQLLLAKDMDGYRNLSKLCSLGYIDGLYSKFPRIDMDLIRQYKDGLIATSCCIGAQIPQAIIHKGEEEAEKIFLEWHELFGDDFYIELQRHHIEDLDGTGVSQEDVNQVLIKWSKKYDVPVIATNDSHYVEEEDANAHDILLCINTGDKVATPKGHGKGYRFGFPNEQFYFKTKDEMLQLFSDIPEAVDNTMMIADKITNPKLSRDILLPNYTLPEGFKTQDEYLRFLTFEGAKKRYGTITAEIEERLNFELKVIADSGYPGYFLIVQDFTTIARKEGVSVGPGRGSAAGSAVAYCIGITNVDPIKYDLLFERFLNPERVSMPDIDIDFDDEGRQKVIDYVVEKYGRNQVAQIITYGSMAAKSSLRDVGRVLDVPLPEVDKITKSFPDHLSASLNAVLAAKGVDPKLKDKLNNQQKQDAEEFRKLAENDDLIGKTIHLAKRLEGSVRNTGIHACGVIITPDDITNYVPVTVGKDSDLLVTQFDNSVVEEAGLLKMDFLGLKTLTIIKDAIKIIEKNHDIKIDPDAIPLDDEKTYELFQRGDTNGIFQFESPGMQKHLKSLKPNKFEDLIAMNALYRPGPMEYIPEYVARKHGDKAVEYDLRIMEDILQETYGITVYQEQVMLLSQKMAGFTKGQADSLRKAMGKKKKDLLDQLFPLFVEGCKENGLDEEKVKKVWKDWEAFASYAFNKSHSTCYAFVAFQTAYLKAHYPAEYMAAVLTHNMSDIKKVTFFMDECRRLRIPVLGPDVNESRKKFTVNKNGEIRFALAAIKGVGESAVEAMVEEREANGPFNSIFDMTRRVNLRAVNKKAMESLALAGAFDCFEGVHRAQYFHTRPGDTMNVLENAIKHGQTHQSQESANQNSLFGGMEAMVPEDPKIPECEEWTNLEKLQREREMVGVYISGHPLDAYKLEMETFTDIGIDELQPQQGRTFRFAGIISSAMTRFSKSGDKYCRFTIEDYTGSAEFMLFKEDYLEFGKYVEHVGNMVHITGSYELPWREATDLRFKVKSISLLSEVKDKFSKQLSIHLSAKQVNEEFIHKLNDLFAQHTGDLDLRMTIIDESMEKPVSFLSRKYRVNVSQELLDRLEGDLKVGYKLN
jgi:DNA polymerase-3 subunit alpha